jgi:hypothetical protein
MNPKEPLYHTHEVNLGACRQKLTEQCFHLWVLREVNKIVNVEAKSEFCGQRDAGGIGWVPNKCRVEAWILEGRAQPKGTRIAFILSYQCLGLQLRP